MTSELDSTGEQPTSITMPHLQRRAHQTQLIVHGKPYFIFGGELGNSSASNMAYLEPAWPKLKAMQLNTLLAPVYWELLEPTEGTFAFTLVEQLIQRARQEEIKLVLLWFGSWKNSMSTYVPTWVKRDQTRFPRAQDANGISQEILTPFVAGNLAADSRAFAALMKFLCEFDSKEQTVIMVQVENEIGMLPSARDHHPAANAAYHDPVPPALMHYLQKQRASLVPEVTTAWASNDFRTEGTWEQIFGAGLATHERFMAWHFARYADAVAAAGKAVYPLPMFVNAALNRPNVLPGDYPSGGPLPHLLDIWKAAAPNLDLLVPDFYNPDFAQWNDRYTQQGDPLLIPEIRFDETVGAKALFAFGNYNCLGFSPFAIESTTAPLDETLTQSYRLLAQVTPLLANHPAPIERVGMWVTKAAPEQLVTLGDYQFTVRHDLTLGWSPAAADAEWCHGGGILFQTGKEEYLLVGTGLVITVKPANGQGHAGIDTLYEGEFVDGQWQPGRALNGDQTHQGRHIRIPHGTWGIQKLTLYRYA